MILVKCCEFHEISRILVKMSKIAKISTFRPTRPACRPGGAERLSAAEPTLVASDPMLGAPHRAQGLPDGDLGATGSRPRGHQFATSGPAIRDLRSADSRPRDQRYWSRPRGVIVYIHHSTCA